MRSHFSSPVRATAVPPKAMRRFGREFVYIVRTILCCGIDEPQPPASGPITWRTPEAIVVIECCSMQLERLHLVIEA
jgi:hypothetical protein